jgi:hypothetical protein
LNETTTEEGTDLKSTSSSISSIHTNNSVEMSNDNSLRNLENKGSLKNEGDLRTNFLEWNSENEISQSDMKNGKNTGDAPFSMSQSASSLQGKQQQDSNINTSTLFGSQTDASDARTQNNYNAFLNSTKENNNDSNGSGILSKDSSSTKNADGETVTFSWSNNQMFDESKPHSKAESISHFFYNVFEGSKIFENNENTNFANFLAIPSTEIQTWETFSNTDIENVLKKAKSALYNNTTQNFNSQEQQTWNVLGPQIKQKFVNIQNAIKQDNMEKSKDGLALKTKTESIIKGLNSIQESAFSSKVENSAGEIKGKKLDMNMGNFTAKNTEINRNIGTMTLHP